MIYRDNTLDQPESMSSSKGSVWKSVRSGNAQVSGGLQRQTLYLMSNPKFTEFPKAAPKRFFHANNELHHSRDNDMFA